MPSKKPNPQILVSNGAQGFQGKRRSVSNGGKSQKKKSMEPDHWGFLEDIDAPMWVDLTQESKSMSQDIDDGWFHVAHPFHECSSHQLMSVYTILGEKVNLNSDLCGSSSPKLPPSVSRSRGKNYRSKKWRDDSHVISAEKQHPIKNLGRKTLRVISCPSHEVKPKTRIGYTNLRTGIVRKNHSKPANLLQKKPSSRIAKCNSSLKSSLVGKSSSTETESWGPDFVQIKTSCGDLGTTSSLDACFVCESNGSNSSKHISASGDSGSSSNTNITVVEQCNQPETVNEISHQIVGRKSEFLYGARVNFRKSVVSRQASRVEVKDGGSKSSSSKSSVGSNSIPGCNGENEIPVGKLKLSRTPESKRVVRVAQPTKDKKLANVSKPSNIQILDLNKKKSRREGTANTVKTVCRETSKLKSLYKSEAIGSLRNVRDPSTTGLKAKMSLAGNSNANPLVKKAGGKENTVLSMPLTQKVSKHDSEVTSGKAYLDPKANANGRKERRSSKNVIHKTYFR